MKSRLARLATTTAIVGLVLAAVPPGVSAECSNLVPDEELGPGIQAAFLATVTEASTSVDPNPDANPWDWHVELRIDETYVGRVPSTLSFNGYEGGCAELQGGALRTGDRILIAVEQLALDYLPAAPFERHSMIWHKTSEGWSFFLNAVPGQIRSGFYPDAAVNATTKAGILAFIAAHSMPSTSTHPAAPASWSPSTFLLGLAAVIGFGLGWRRFRGRPHVTWPDAD